MEHLLAITKNTFLQVVRQPIYGIIVLVTLGSLALSPSLIGWTLDDDNKMLRDVGLSTLLIQGLFLACFAASSVIDAEIEDRTVLTSIAKPVRRSLFVFGKYLGVMGALTAAHYLAGIAFFMTMRHGVLQTASESSDISVIVLGPGLMALLLALVGLLNYLYEWRYLVTLLTLAVPCMTLSAMVLLVVDRDFKLQTWEVTMTMDNLPPEAADPENLKGIATFRPLEQHSQIEGHRGHLVRKWWQGPINAEDRQTLQNVSSDLQWRKDVRFLVQTTQEKLQGTDILKAGILILGALAILAAVAVAASTRVGMFATFLICLVVISAGLASDQIIRPAAAKAGELSAWRMFTLMILPVLVPALFSLWVMFARGTARIVSILVTACVVIGGAIWIYRGLEETGGHWAEVLYRIIPNLQFFWLVDALSENRVIPWDYVGSTMAYGVLYTMGILALAVALFETREVG